MSVTAATLTLAKTSIGIGVMALPYAHLQGGILAVPGMFLFALWNWVTSWQLLGAYEVLTEAEKHSRTGYSAVAHAALGSGGVLLYDTLICMLLTGVCSSIQVQAVHLMDAYVDLPLDDGANYAMMVLLSSVCLMPLALLRDLSRLAGVAVVALSVLAAGLLAVAGSGISRFGLPPPPERLLALPDLTGIATFFSIAAFSFGMQTTLLPVRDGMREPHRALEAASFAVVVVGCANAVVGVGLAWLYVGGEGGVDEIILLNLPPGSLLSAFVEISTAIVNLLGYPLLMLPVMQMLLTRLPPAIRVAGAGLRLGFLACTTVLALLLSDFAVVASLFGCLSIFVCLVLPPLCHLRLSSWPPAHRPPPTGGNGSARVQPVAAALDATILIVGACAFAYFTAVALRRAAH